MLSAISDNAIEQLALRFTHYALCTCKMIG
jgi:hypothetical protein